MELSEKNLFLFDIDGTVSIGEKFIPGGHELLDYIKNTGKKYIFITNNSTRGTKSYIDKFRRMGLETDGMNFVTAATASLRYLSERYKGKKIYTVGTKSFIDELRAGGMIITEKFESGIDCVLVGFDNELTYRKIENACRILSESEADFLATNPDLVCPAPFGFVPDCGSICRMITEAVGREPVFLGKPERLIIDICLEISGCSADETVIVGDRLYTDILSGIKSGIDTAAVLTGETDRQEISLVSNCPKHPCH